MPVYNVLIGLKSRPGKGIIKANILENKLLRGIVEPYNRGEDFRCDDEIVSRDDISSIKITESEKASIGPLYRPSHQRLFADRWQAINQMKDVTRKFIKTPPKREVISKKREKAKQQLSKNIFIVHGSDHNPMKKLKVMLKEFGLNPIVLHEQPSGSRTIVEKLEKYSDVGYAFVILTPDDIGIVTVELFNEIGKLLTILENSFVEGKQSMMFRRLEYEMVAECSSRIREITGGFILSQLPRARQNVILEFGYFMGLLGRDRVCCLYKGNVELPSDMHGIVYIPFEETVNEVGKKIAKELKAAGYKIKM